MTATRIPRCGRSGRAAALFCLLPAAVFAQRSGMGGMGGGMGRGGALGGARTFNRPAALEIPKYVNPINLLIAHRQDLALSDSQFARVIRVKRAVDSTNAPLMRKLDSVQVLFKGGGPLFGSPSAERRDSLAEARSLVQETLGTVRDNIADGKDRAYALLSSQQRVQAEAYEDKALRALDEENRAGRGGADGRGPGGKPPSR